MLEKDSAFIIGKNLIEGGAQDIDLTNVKDIGKLLQIFNFIIQMLNLKMTNQF